VAGFVSPFPAGDLDKTFAIRRPYYLTLAKIVSLLCAEIVAAGNAEDFSTQKIDNVIAKVFFLRGVNLLSLRFNLLITKFLPIDFVSGQA